MICAADGRSCPKPGTGEEAEGGVREITDPFVSMRIDPLKTIVEEPIGLQGMKIDRMFFGHFEETIKQHDFVVDKVTEGDFKAAEDYIREKVFDKPEEYYNLAKLRKAAQVDRRITLREILEKIFNLISGFKSRNELLEEECDKFISIHKPVAEFVLPIKNFLKAYITDSTVREIVESKQYARFATSPVGDYFRALSPEWRNLIPEYVKDYVTMNTFI